MRVVDRVIGFVSTLILARLLTPADFGVVAMGTAIQSILISLTEFGFTKALIRMKRPRHEAYSTAFTLNFLTNATVALVMLLSIPVAQAWYDDSRVGQVLLILAAVSFVSGLRNLGLAKYERALNFRPFFVLALVRKLASFCFGVALALWWNDYRALLAGMLMGTVVETAATYRLTNFRPRFTFGKARELLGFSLWWLGSEVTSALGQRGQDLLVGQRLGAVTLGEYAVSLDLATMAPTEIAAPVMRAMYPGYMQMKDDVGRLYSAFVRVWGVIALLAIPSAVGVACVAGLITNVVLGPKWSGATPLIVALAAVGCVQAFSGCCWPVLLTRLGPKTLFHISLLRVALTIPVFGFALFSFGLLPAIASWVACGVLMLFLNTGVILKNLKGNLADLLGGIIRPTTGALAMVLTLGGARTLPAATALPEFVQLLLAVVLGAISYVVAVAVLWAASGRPQGAERELMFVVQAKLQIKN